MAVVYAIRNRFNGFVYVGCTANSLAKRAREHFGMLRRWEHTATKMQTDWEKYGRDGFEAVVLEELPSDASVVIKRARELYWMQFYSTSLYNAFQISFTPCAEATRRGVANAHNKPGNRWTPEVNLKRSIAQKGKPKGHGAKISATKQARKAARLNSYEIVCSTAKTEAVGASDKEPGT